MNVPTESELAKAIELAARVAIQELFDSVRERFYYCSLITTGEAHPPNLVAWSHEALDKAVAEAGDPSERPWLEWSYADSPYFCFGERHFEPVRQLFSLRPQMDHELSTEDWMAEYELRLKAMEAAMATLNDEGLFGVPPERYQIVVNVEVMPPDYTNTERAKRLNPPDSIATWLEEVAEPP